MRKEVVRFVGLAALLLGTVMAWGQQPAGAPAASDKKTEDKPAKSKLEEMLEKALHDNPDVRLADAKLAEAEAELNRARLLVVQKVASAYQAVEAQKAAVDSATAQLEELKKAAASGAVPQADLRAAEQQLIDAKAKLADLESQLPYLMGQQPPGVDDKISAAWTDFRQRRDASPDPVLMRARLPRPVRTAAYQGRADLRCRPHAHVARSHGRPHPRRAGQAVHVRDQGGAARGRNPGAREIV